LGAVAGTVTTGPVVAVVVGGRVVVVTTELGNVVVVVVVVVFFTLWSYFDGWTSRLAGFCWSAQACN